MGLKLLNRILIFLKISLLVLCLTNIKLFGTEEKKMNYQIIHFNGPSSSGKSELIKELQASLDTPFLHVGIDKVIGMMPAHTNNWEGGYAPLGFCWKAAKDEDGTPMYELQMGPFAHQISQTYRELVLRLAELGHFIIIDDVAFGKKEFDRWKALLVDYKVLYVGIHASLDVLEERERKRGNRIIGSARAQFRKVHEGINYDLDIHTHQDTLCDNVSNNIKKLNKEI